MKLNIIDKIKAFNKYRNPYYWWWKARKHFKRPKAHFVCGRFDGYFGFPCRTDYYFGWPKICMTGLGWKDKWNSPRHEWDPAIALIWTSPFKTTEENRFSKDNKFTYNKQYWIGFIFNWVKKGSDYKDDSHTASLATWEAILDMVVYKKSLKCAISHHIWRSGCGEDAHDITIENNLKYG